jgi:outer membrane protein assembly factor BamB
MEKAYSQTFEMKSGTLCYDSGKSILLCRGPENGKNLWIKKITDISLIDTVIEDASRYYIACEADDVRGFFLALSKSNGSTEWFIPGKAYFQIIFEGYLYLIFTDGKNEFYLIKVDCSDGKKIWYHRISGDLCEYAFRADRILLKYGSGKAESISPLTGIAAH